MKYKNTFTKTILLVLCLGITCFMLAGTAWAKVSTPTKLTSFSRITQDLTPQKDTFISVSRGQLVYTDWNGTDYDIYNYDVTSGNVSQISSAGDQVQAYVYGDWVIYKDWSENHPELYLYNLSTRTKTFLMDIYGTTNPQSHTSDRGPRVYGHTVVWEDYRNGNWDIYSYDFIASQLKQITSTTAQETNPFLNRSTLAYVKNAGPYNNDVYQYRLDTGVTTPVSTATGHQTAPRVSKDYIVWLDGRNYPGTAGTYDIGYYNLATQEEGFLPLNGTASGAQVFDDLMVYSEQSTAGDAVYLYNLTTKTNELVAVNGQYPFISKDAIYWVQQTGTTTWDIYTAEILPDTPGSDLNLQTTILGQPALYFLPAPFYPIQATLTGKNGVNALYTPSTPWLIEDARGTGAGWYTTISADDLTSSDNKIISNSNLYLSVTDITKAPFALTSSDPSVFKSVYNISLAVPATMLSATQDQGMGSFNFLPVLELNLPANSYARDYTGTLYVSIYENAPAL